MTRPKAQAPKKNGRPFVHTVTEKPCRGCGRIFTMEERGILFPSHFRDTHYCSDDCRRATPNAGGNVKWTSLEKLLAAGARDAVTGCINWPQVTRKGYGFTSYNGRTVRTHRLSFELANGSIPAGLMILHQCDNRRCINPDHLRAGTAKENFEDAVSKGRQRHGPSGGFLKGGGGSSLTSAPPRILEEPRLRARSAKPMVARWRSHAPKLRPHQRYQVTSPTPPSPEQIEPLIDDERSGPEMIRSNFEPDARASGYDLFGAAELSVAISLKRIADALTKSHSTDRTDNG